MMIISSSVTLPKITGTLYNLAPVPRSSVLTPQDPFDISETARQKIDQLQQGNQVLEQAVTQSRQAIRGAAMERVSAAMEYLKILARLSPAGDRGAASEAARIAKEIKSAAADFKAGITSGRENGVNSDIAGFAGVAGDALNLANGLVKSYLKKRKERQNGDSDMEQEISSASATVRGMVSGALAESQSK